jgi:hypothetical protein
VKERWFVFDGVAVFDHEVHRFWHRNQIKELGLDLWENMEMEDITKNPTNKDLSWVIRQELSYYTDAKTDTHKYWDDEGRWELIEVPYDIGFGIIQGDNERFIELVNECNENLVKG